MAQNESTYTLDNTWEQARHRLSLLEKVFDPGTIDRLTRLGVTDGWRCLEVGAGAGSIARWLCDRVGPSGTVTAVDMDPRFLYDDAPPNLEIVERNILTDGLPGEGYDLIHTRALLMHLPDPEAVVALMARHLRPGGVLLVEDADFLAVDMCASELYREIFEACCAAAARMGGDWYWGRRLPAAITAAELTDPGVEVYTPFFQGGEEPYTELVAMTWEQLTPLITEAGFAPERIAKARAELEDPGGWFMTCSLVAAWGRRPA